MFYNDQPPYMIFYQGLARLQLRDNDGAESCFRKLIDYGELHLSDQVSIDYFAVSLPDFLLFDDDLQKRNEIHCHYMMGLGYLGLQEFEQARTHFDHVLKLDVHHQGARIHREM
jgi:tetratricopeptide (TPR) repeat protein